MKTRKISNRLNDVELKKKEDSAKCTCSKPQSGLRRRLSEASHTSALFLPTSRSSSSLVFSELFLHEPTGRPVRTVEGFPCGTGPSSHPACPSEKLQDSLS